MTPRRLWDRIVLPLYVAHFWWYCGGFEELKARVDAEYEKAKREYEEARAAKRNARGTDQ